MTFAAIAAQPLEASAFEPFGEVLSVPQSTGRAFFEKSLASLRSDAWPSLSLARIEAVADGPVVARRMERHEFSSQSFVPLHAARWIVAVAPHGADGKPDMAGFRAFLPQPGQGVTYGANVWHHPLTVLDAPATFAVMMWRNATATDEEFVDLPEPLVFELPR